METQKAAIYKPSREASEETNPANTVILDFQPQNSEDREFLLVGPPGLWRIVVVASAN